MDAVEKLKSMNELFDDLFVTPLGVLFERDRQRLAAEKEEKEEKK